MIMYLKHFKAVHLMITWETELKAVSDKELLRSTPRKLLILFRAKFAELEIRSNPRYVDPKGKSPTQWFKSKSSFALLIGSLVICIKIRTNGLDPAP